MSRKLSDEERREHRRFSLMKYSNSEKRKQSLKRFKDSGNYALSKSKNHLKERCYVEDGKWHLIEGYDRMLKEGFDELHRGNRWVLHHRLEEKGLSNKDLVNKGLYYNRPPSELIWLTRKEHNNLHFNLRRKMKLVRMEVATCLR